MRNRNAVPIKINGALVAADARIAEIRTLQANLEARIACLRDAAVRGFRFDDLDEIAGGIRKMPGVDLNPF